MSSKQHSSHKHKDNAKPPVPSTGRGADSALDAMIKRRVVAPGPGNSPPPATSKKH